MSKQLAVGTKLSIGTLATALAFTAATNATQTVLTMASTTGIAAGDYVIVTSGWAALDGRTVRVVAATTNVSITLEGINTTSTTDYPAGAGAGSVRKVTWVALTQLTNALSVTGGELQTANATGMDDKFEVLLPTIRSALRIGAPFFFDASLAWITTVRDSFGINSPWMLAFPVGRTVGSGLWSVREVPTIEDSTLRGAVDVLVSVQPVIYAT